MIKLTIDKSERCNEEYSVFATFKYDNDIINIIRSIPGRMYIPDTREWEIPYSQLERLVKNIEGKYDYGIYGEVEEEHIHMIPENYVFKTKPFKHQLEAIEFGLKHEKWLLGDSMGLGKTKTAIDIACIKKELYGYKHCLIICGINSLKWNWVNEVHTHSNEKAYILGQREKKGKIQIGSNKDKLDDITHLNGNEAFFIITNIETLRSQECLSALLKMAYVGELNMIVLDEAHVAKNPTSQQGKALLKLKAETMIAMTGTPLMNKPIDLYAILKWLGYENHNFWAFKNYYCVFGGFGGHEIVGYKNLKQLQEQLEKIMLRRLKEDVFDLPDKIFVDEYVDMLPKQEIIYKEVLQSVNENIDKIAASFNPLAELIRLRQATGYPGILSTIVEESAKLDRMLELMEEAKENKQKVVIFSNWTQITDAAYDRLLDEGFVGQMITGDTKDEQRQLIVDIFQTSEYQDFIIGTIGAIGTGLTLSAGTVEIFLDEPWNMALKNQAIDRCHRIGTKNNVTIYTIMCKNTIDEKIHDLVEQKGAISDYIVDGKLNISNADLVHFLLNS